MPAEQIPPVQPTASPNSEPESIVTQQDSSPPRGNPFPVVGIGASAGGLEAFSQLLSAVEPDTGMAFVLVQHLDPQHESLLSEILAPLTKMPVITVHDGIHIEPDRVYVIPPNTSMVIEDSHLKLARREAGTHLPIDIFLCSLAAVQGSRAIGVVLSGNASDGSLGLRAIKSECGITFAQDEATARFSGMPRNAIATGAVDRILSPGAIGRELSQLGRHPFLITARPGVPESETLPEGDGDLKRVFALLRAGTRVDFSHYKPTTVRRRIGRRMMVLRLDSLDEYAQYAEKHPNELRELYRDLLISVTSFFRDPGAFKVLRELLAKMLASQPDRREPFRVWVPGCATGEELYSLAICLHELLADRQRALPIQLFGTDLSELALDRARRAIYPESIAENLSPVQLRRFFNKIDGSYQIGKLIRESCIFARHDVTKDPPFSQIDLLSCRNLLIYLDVAAQRQVLPSFHYSLRTNGLLLLGRAETTGAAHDLFTPVDKQHSLYRPKPGPIRFAFSLNAGPAKAENPRPPVRLAASTGLDLQQRLDRIIQSKYSPSAVLVDSDLQIIHFRGHTSPYLDPTPGDASLNLLRMARENLVVPLRRALHTAANGQHSIKEQGLVVERDGHRQTVTLEITPVPGESPGELYWLVVFAPELSSPIPAASGHSESSSDGSRVAQLERELSDARDHLRHITEEYEAHAEELRAANEEARSANEELQSTNEELGTTKEELQSSNEELTTINEELQHRNVELGATNNDLHNLFSAVSVAVVLIDSDLRVRRFNAVAEKLLNLGPIDIGRPVGHLRGRINTPDLENQVHEVIETLRTAEAEVQDHHGHWYLVATRPYRTLDDHIAGAVITIQDIDPLKRGIEAAEEARDYAEGIVETVREPLLVLDADLRVRRATPAFYETFLVSREETQNRFFYDLGNGQWNQPRLRELIGGALFRNEPFQNFEIQHDFPNIGRRNMYLNARRLPGPDAQNRTVLLAIEDATESHEVAEIRFQRLFETAKDGIMLVEAGTGLILEANPCFLQSTGFSPEQIIGRKLSEAKPFQDYAEAATLVSSLSERDTIRRDDVPLRTAHHGIISTELVANLYRVGAQSVVQLNFRDITQRKEQEESLRRSAEDKAVLVREIHHRVKNNLQVIVSLLSLQAGYTNDPKALAAFEDTEGRVRAIAHIHETLYATPDLAQIEFSAYLTHLIQELLTVHSLVPDGITLDLQAEEMVLDMEQAIPLGLIANELILNVLKHGLVAGRGRLAVALSYMRDQENPQPGEELDSGWVQLRVSDNGPGLPPGADLSSSPSMGFKLLNLLVRQLHGKVEFSSGPGVTVSVQFPLTQQES